MSQSPYKSSIRVSKWELREIFNEDRYEERAACGELRMEIKRSRPVPPGKIDNWVPGTMSQELKFYDATGLMMAKAHRYLHPDGKTILGSGKADPKRVVRNGVMHIEDGADPDQE